MASAHLTQRLDVQANRAATKYTARELAQRVLWGAGAVAFRLSPRTAFGWRRFLLRLFGARVGAQVHAYRTATVYMPWNLSAGDWSSIGEHALIYNLGHVAIGARATVSYRAHLCAGSHDYRDPAMALSKEPVTIGADAWICTDAFVGPGVAIGEGAVVGARAVVVEDVEPWTVVAGNPARFIRRRELSAGTEAPE